MVVHVVKLHCQLKIEAKLPQKSNHFFTSRRPKSVCLRQLSLQVIFESQCVPSLSTLL